MFKNGLTLKDGCYVPEYNDFYKMMEKVGVKARDEGLVRMSLVSLDNFWENVANWKCVVYTCLS